MNLTFERWGPGKLRLAALALLSVPAVVLLLFAFGEMLDGDLSGAQHLPEAGVLLVLMAAAWWRPRLAGIVLVGGAVLLFVAWAAWVVFVREDEGNGSALMWVAAAVILFLPPFVAGWLLLRASSLAPTDG